MLISVLATALACLLAGGLEAVQEIAGDGEYFMGILANGTRLVAPLMPGQRLPMNLGREILADLAGCQERAEWKAAVLPGTAAEEKAAEAFKGMFAKYDIMG